jgi:hypothetical protein
MARGWSYDCAEKKKQSPEEETPKTPCFNEDHVSTSWIINRAGISTQEGAFSARQPPNRIPEGLRPMALRPALSNGLPFSSVHVEMMF